MSFIDKLKNKMERVSGQAKETAGDVTGNASLKREGKADQTKGNLKDAGEKVKDALQP